MQRRNFIKATAVSIAFAAAGFASQPSALGREDGLRLRDALVTATVRCPPPANKPLPSERANCREYLELELDLFLPRLRVLVALGGYAWDHVLSILAERGQPIPSPKPRFAHGAEVSLDDGPTLLASYHPSQQNTFTGRLTQEMFDRVWSRARGLLDRDR